MNLATQAAYRGNYEKGLLYGDTLYQESKAHNYIGGVLSYYSLRGYVYQVQGNIELAYQEYREALILMDSTQYESFHQRIIFYKNLASIFYKQGKVDSTNVYIDRIIAFPCNKETLGSKYYVIGIYEGRRELKNALYLSQQVLECARDIDPQMTRILMQQRANIYTLLEDYEMSLQYIDSTLQLAKEQKDSICMVTAYNLLGVEYAILENYEEGLVWFRKSVELAEILSKIKILNKGKSSRLITLPMAALYSSLGGVYYDLDQLDSSVFYLKKSLEISYKSKNYFSAYQGLVTLGGVFIKEKKFQEAIDSFQRAYEVGPKYQNRKFQEFYIYVGMGEAYKGQNNMDQANKYYTKAESIAKELEDDNKLVNVYKQIELFYIEKGDYKKAYEYQGLKGEHEIKIRSQKNKNASLRFEIKYESEKLKRENLELEKNQEIQTKEIAFSQALNTRNQYIIVGLILLFLLLGGVGLLIYKQRNLQTQFKIMGLEQKALKAQINPHFFFNVLNSLQGIILSEAPKVAYKFHAKFTKLMRLILMQSDKDGIKLQEELEGLELYLELEQLRTGNAFDFEIVNTVDSSDELVVPSMLLQPFVENSIWHGVMNRREGEEKKIIIRVEKNDKGIVCEIEDTGVGRAQAQLIKQQQTNKHESMGMKVTQDRLELFQLRYKVPLDFLIKDLLNKQGTKVLGTSVKLKIPIVNS